MKDKKIDVDWNVLGNNENRIIVRISITEFMSSKKWWEFWKKDDAQIISNIFLGQMFKFM